MMGIKIKYNSYWTHSLEMQERKYDYNIKEIQEKPCYEYKLEKVFFFFLGYGFRILWKWKWNSFAFHSLFYLPLNRTRHLHLLLH